MKNGTLLIPICLGLAVALIGCQPASYDPSAPCGDREALFCEDFESISSSMSGHSSTNDFWEVAHDGDLNLWKNSLPIDGRSRSYLVSIGLYGGNYENNSMTLLYTPRIDLMDAAKAELHFNILYHTEPNWDGLIVIASPDEGENWYSLEPKDGYPGSVKYQNQLLNGYTGRRLFWTHEVVDLDHLLGSEINIGFLFLSDFSITSYGVVLDDIVVEADNQANLITGENISTLLEVNLVLPQEPVIIGEILRAIPLADIPCGGEQDEVLRDGQRAFVKATNETGDRFLVLHPESGNFCWVGGEDIWIDGHDWDLPQVSDKKPEDLYLSACALSQTPFLNDPECFSSNAAGEYPAGLSYHLQQAIVEKGKIKFLLMDPGGEPSRGIMDPSIYLETAEKSEYIVEDRGGSGGTLEVYINDIKQTCGLDVTHPGRLICDDLSIAIANELQVEICWQGWDAGSSCPLGFATDQEKTSCVILSDLDTCTPECPEGYLFSSEKKLCQVDYKLGKENSELCPNGSWLIPQAGCCATTDPTLILNCLSGYYFTPASGACLRLTEGGSCPDGYTTQDEAAMCIPEDDTKTPICTSFDIQFPKQEVTVKEHTRCWKGPGDEYEAVSSLKPFTIVDVLGIGENDEYIVILNPKFQIPCWVNGKDLYIENLDLYILPIIPVEAPGDPGDKPNQGGSAKGCMVAEDMTSAPKCVVPCPDPEKYPNSCNP